MQDLDLDELDSAVSAMMDKPRGKRSADKGDAGIVKNTTPSTTEPSQTEPPKPAVTPAKPVATPLSVSSPARLSVPTGHADGEKLTVNRPMPRVPERKRTHPGAMDIIQPAPPPKLTPPSARPARTAPALQPTQPSIKPEPVKPVAPQPMPAPSEPVKEQTPGEVSDEVLASLAMHDEPKSTPAKPAEPPKDTGEHWPDPLDFHDFNDTPAKKDATPATIEPDALLAPDDEPAAPPETPPTLTSQPQHEPADIPGTTPFVTTKVEKRPLGAYANVPAESKAPEEAQSTEPTTDTTPAEHAPTSDGPSKSEMAHAALQSNQHVPKEDEPEHEPHDLRQMAIPQQYHTAEHEPNKDNVHHLFDTKEYQAPPQIIHPARKGGSPWFAVMIVVLIVLLLGVALAGYFVMTGTFDITSLW